MDNLDNAFFHLKHLPLVDTKHAELAINAEYNKKVLMRLNICADAVEFSDSKLCRDLRNYFGECEAGYVKTPAMSGYDWHMDIARKTSINILLVQPPAAQTLHKLNINRLTYRLRLCDYEMFRPTVFNSAIPHCVINPSNQDRYILTISIGNIPKYDDLKNWLINYDTDSY